MSANDQTMQSLLPIGSANAERRISSSALSEPIYEYVAAGLNAGTVVCLGDRLETAVGEKDWRKSAAPRDRKARSAVSASKLCGGCSDSALDGFAVVVGAPTTPPDLCGGLLPVPRVEPPFPRRSRGRPTLLINSKQEGIRYG
jgi:hypothetical protein